MVSPSKKKRDKKGRETTESSVGVKDKLGSRKHKVFKPLATKKFYLDIKNSAALLKVETRLKSLGANIEQFLVKEVNYVVTDRKDSLTEGRPSTSCSTPASPSPSPSPSPSVGVSSPLDGLGQKKTRSRAEAMLERVRLQPQSVQINPLDNARSWNIPIYSIQEILLRLEKISSKAPSNSKSAAPGLKVLRGHYLKLETAPVRRPEFKELRQWPNINLQSARGESPFVIHADGSQRMTRKVNKDGTERLAGGYCEMCCIDYPDIKAHVLTPQHLKFANDTENYAELDNLIKSKNIDTFLTSQMCAGVGARKCSRGGSVEKVMGSRHSSLSQSNGQLLPRTRAVTRSLDDSCTKKPLEVQCNGIVNHNHLTRAAVKSDSVLGRELGELEGISRRTRTISASCPATNTEYSQLSPTGSDSTHHLRSRKQIWMPTSLLGTTAEDALNNSRLRPNREYPVAEALKSPTSAKSMKSPTLPVADEMPEKKMKGKEENEMTKSSSAVHNDVDKGLYRESSDEEEDCERKDKVGTKINESVKSKEYLKKIGSKKKSKKRLPQELANLSYNDKRKKIQRKRLSVEEKLIEDNRTYYKVEVLNSKLRSTGYYISQSQRELELSKANGTDGCVTQNCAEPVKNEMKSEEKEPVVVRFKKVRKTELSLLSDEAESFMFGEPSRRESSVSTVSSEEEDDEVSLKLESEDRDRIVTKIKREVIDESSMGSCSITSSSTSSRRKRKNADEIIIQDNADYYKFESTGSRLRFHNALFPSTPVNIKAESLSETKSGNSLKVKLDESHFGPENIVTEEKLDSGPKHSYEDLEFSFEKVPTHESWYQVFKRQDDCNEIHYPRYTDYPKVLLPYEYPSPILRQFKIEALKEKGGKRKKYKSRKETKIQQLIADDKPRKSPRCHASTLAIMSSLMRRRPRDSPEKRSDLSTSEVSLPPCEMIVQDEESRCSTIIEPPSVAPSDTQMSTGQTTIQIPEIKIDSKSENLINQQKRTEEEIRKAEEDIDNLFAEMCNDNEEDFLSHILYSVKKEIDSSPTKDNPKKGKGKNKSASKREKPEEFPDVSTCLPIDPEVFLEDMPDSNLSSGPIVDVLNLIDTYRGCSSMERADYEHLNPHAVDALRVLIAESCNSSDCGGSSACCDYSFLGEDGRVCKKRKRKKRNMTGWPVKKKFTKKGEELSTVVLKRNCKARSQCSEVEPTKGKSDIAGELEVDVKKEPSEPLSENQDHSVEDSEVKTESVKLGSTISRTTSIDSSSTKSFDVQSCYIRVKKMPENCVESFTRHLRSSDSSSPNSSSRRGSSRQAKIVGRESLRRCR